MAFSKNKIAYEREEISDCQDLGNPNGAADGDWENCVGPKVPTLNGTEESLSYAQCFLCRVSSSTDVFIFHITWLDTFWTDLLFGLYCIKLCFFYA